MCVIREEVFQAGSQTKIEFFETRYLGSLRRSSEVVRDDRAPICLSMIANVVAVGNLGGGRTKS